MSFLMRSSLNAAFVCRSCRIARQSIPSRFASTVLDSENISKITEKEKEITGQVHPVRSGPTAQAQKHVGEQLNSQNISDITKGERKITGQDQPVRSGPTSAAQRILSENQTSNISSPTRNSTVNASNNNDNSSSGVLDSATISKVTDAEKRITGSDNPAKGGPTAQAQKHAGEPITSEALSDITAGEKKIAGERVKGGPTSTAQSELGQSRN